MNVSSRLATAASRVRSQVTSCGIRCGQSGTEAGLLRVLQFPLPILIRPTASLIFLSQMLCSFQTDSLIN
jgi:hypothetical protein